MARPSQYISFTKEESELIRHVQVQEDWRKTAWAKYGSDWPGYVPDAVNAFIYYYFDTLIPPYGLAMYYCPIVDQTVHGGRGSAKTTTIGLTGATYTALHPGENWLHISITKDQVGKAHSEIVTRGAPDGKHVRFMERFTVDSITAPFPEIRFKPWGPTDPGNKAYFRSLGGDDSIERLRSITAAFLTCDESFRDVETDQTYSQLFGCVRGVNEFRLSLLPEELQHWFRMSMYKLGMILDPEAKRQSKAELDAFIEKYALSIRGSHLLAGNAGSNEWEWSRHDLGYSDPQHYWSFTATWRDNPYFGEQNGLALERSFGDNRELMMVEMYASRPTNLGDIFIAHNIRQCTSKTMLPEIQRAAEDHQEGYVFRSHSDYGCFHYETPPLPQHLYVLGCDPGVGRAPLRNKWVITVWDISEKPVRLVAFEMGYISERQVGDYNGFLQRLVYYGQVYPTAPGDIWVESTGPQKGMAQVGYPEQLRLTAVELTTLKPVLTNYLIQLLGHNLILFPEVSRILIELGNYTLPDKKITQDIVMAMICAAGGIWRYYGENWEIAEPTDEPTLVTLDRRARPMERAGSQRQDTPSAVWRRNGSRS